jgi:hypothetical protein
MSAKLYKFAVGEQPLDPAVQQYLAGYNNPPQEESSSNPLAKVLGAAATHKLVDSGLTYGVRRSGLLDNYYANAAREGLNAGLSGIDVAPKYRRGFGLVSPGLTGLGDYETSRGVAQEIKQRYEALTGKKLTSVDQLISDPLGKRLLHTLNTENSSPLVKNMVNALDPNLKQNSFIEMIKRHGGTGVDNQRAASRISGAIGAGMGLLTGNVTGAIGNVLSMAPDMAAATLANHGHTQDFVDLKKGLVGSGMIHGVKGDSPAAMMKEIGLHALSPVSGELFEAGQNLGGIANKVFDAPQNMYEAATKPLEGVPGKKFIDRLVTGGTNRMKAPAVNKINELLVNPAKKVISKFI